MRQLFNKKPADTPRKTTTSSSISFFQLPEVNADTLSFTFVIYRSLMIQYKRFLVRFVQKAQPFPALCRDLSVNGTATFFGQMPPASRWHSHPFGAGWEQACPYSKT
jgi:hypothetical protein